VKPSLQALFYLSEISEHWRSCAARSWSWLNDRDRRERLEGERAVREYVEHYHRERNHQELGYRLIDKGELVGEPDGEFECTERLGGLLR
jgi:hypothetical protein